MKYNFDELSVRAQKRAAKDYFADMDTDYRLEVYQDININDTLDYTIQLLTGSDYLYTKTGKVTY